MNIFSHPFSHQWRVLLLVCGLGWSLCVAKPIARAYVLEGEQWLSNTTIVMDLELGNPSAPLLDGSVSWDAVAQAALNIWNPYLGNGVQFRGEEASYTPQKEDGKNTVFFSSTIYGEDFGSDTLAITLLFSSSGVTNEADVLFNKAQPFDSYRGSLRTTGNGELLIDLRRVATHEFGHVLGLDHVAQNAASIMTPAVTNYDTIQADDIAGVESLYGQPPPVAPSIASALSASGQMGKAFSYQIVASKNPTSYGAQGLPAGLTLNPATGLISGTPQADGVYSVTLTATNAVGTDSVVLILTVLTPPVVGGNLALIVAPGVAFSYQITASSSPTLFSASGLPAGLSINATTGVISGAAALGTYTINLSASNAAGTGTAVLVLKVSLNDDSLVYLHRFSYSDGSNPLLPPIQASDGNFYGTTVSGGPDTVGVVYKLAADNTLTSLYTFGGTVQGSFSGEIIQATDGNFYGSGISGDASRTSLIYRISPEGSLTVVHTFGGVEGSSATALIQATDGNFYGSTSVANAGYDSVSIFKLSADGTFSTLYLFHGTPSVQCSTLRQAHDGNFYGTAQNGSAGNGIMFRCTLNGDFTTLYQFPSAPPLPPLTIGKPPSSVPAQGPDGWNPTGALIQASDGNLYGTTNAGGRHGFGTLYRVTTDGALTTLHSFSRSEGISYSPLIQAADGNLYGTAFSGGDDTTEPWASTLTGATGGGTIFASTLAGKVTVLYAFDSSGGINPSGGLLQGKDGNLYGATYIGGGGSQDPIGAGTLFRKGLVTVPAQEAPVVTLAATTPEVTVGSGAIGEFTLSLSRTLDADLTVSYVIKGNGINGTDYVTLSGTKKIKAGKTSKPIKVVPEGNLGGAGKKTVVLVLVPGDGYTVGTTGKVKVKILAGQ